MLKARRRKREETRVSTPGLFSTWTTNVLSIGGFNPKFKIQNSKLKTSIPEIWHTI
jgi:hypothetical protein